MQAVSKALRPFNTYKSYCQHTHGYTYHVTIEIAVLATQMAGYSKALTTHPANSSPSQLELAWGVGTGSHIKVSRLHQGLRFRMARRISNRLE